MVQPVRFSQIGYVYVSTPKIDESITWYTKHLSFQLINKFEDRGSHIAVLHHPHKHAIACIIAHRDRGRSFPTDFQKRQAVSHHGFELS